MPHAITADLPAAVERIAAGCDLPTIVDFILPPALEDPLAHCGARDKAHDNNFAALVLDDGTVGLTYTALDNALNGLRAHLPELSLQGRSPLELIRMYASQSGWERALGLSAINAISQHHLAANQHLVPMPSTVPALELQPGDRLGMVGYFGRLIEPVKALGIPLTVVELDAALVRSDPGIDVTLDATRLRTCTKVVITGTTLLNHTLDRMLACCEQAEHVVLLGPSASCLPEPLFANGVTMVGGFQVTDARRFQSAWHSGSSWRDAGLRYCLTRRLVAQRAVEV